jgi:hypothetical protein
VFAHGCRPALQAQDRGRHQIDEGRWAAARREVGIAIRATRNVGLHSTHSVRTVPNYTEGYKSHFRYQIQRKIQ